MKAIEQYFPVILFIMPHKMVLTFLVGFGEILKCDHLYKAIEHYFPMVLFIMLYKVIRTVLFCG